jgi:guanylate kinase
LAAAHGILFVLSAPSGTGKSTIARRVLERVADLEFSVSFTTRPCREGEQDGRDYHFIERPRFESMVEDGSFLEWAAVFGQLYGTGAELTRAALAEGRNLLLDIDVQGARQVRESGIPNVSVMLLPPDFRSLEARLRGRGSESEDELGNRLAKARREAEDYRFFDYLIVNRNVEQATAELESIVRAERHRSLHAADEAQNILATFPS